MIILRVTKNKLWNSTSCGAIFGRLASAIEERIFQYRLFILVLFTESHAAIDIFNVRFVREQKEHSCCFLLMDRGQCFYRAYSSFNF